MKKFKVGDIIRCKGHYFTEREILPSRSNNQTRYKTKFLDNGHVVEDDVELIDRLYTLVGTVGKYQKKAKEESNVK